MPFLERRKQLVLVVEVLCHVGSVDAIERIVRKRAQIGGIPHAIYARPGVRIQHLPTRSTYLSPNVEPAWHIAAFSNSSWNFRMHRGNLHRQTWCQTSCR